MTNKLQKLSYCEETIQLKQAVEGSFLALGERLRRIKEDLLWEDQWSDFGAFLSEMKLSENMANKLIQIYEVFILKYQLAPKLLATAGGWSVIADILPVAKTKKEAKYWLERAAELTRTDLRRDLMEKKTGKEMRNCKHGDVYLLRVCRDCGIRESVYETEATKEK